MIIPNIWENNISVPNHQPGRVCIYCYIGLQTNKHNVWGRPTWPVLTFPKAAMINQWIGGVFFSKVQTNPTKKHTWLYNSITLQYIITDISFQNMFNEHWE